MKFGTAERIPRFERPLPPVEVPTVEPEPDEAKEEEIRKLWQAHDELQAALNEAWGAYHKACRKNQHHKFRQERMRLDREQARLNAEREALPTRPLVRGGAGMSTAGKTKLIRQIRELEGRGYGGW